jgi:hypothetical protein
MFPQHAEAKLALGLSIRPCVDRGEYDCVDLMIQMARPAVMGRRCQPEESAIWGNTYDEAIRAS